MQQGLKQKVAVLIGGLGSEREVSLKSGRAVAAALSSRGHEVVEIDAGRELPGQLRDAGATVVVSLLHGTYGEDGCVQGLLEVLGIPYSGSGVLASALTMDKVLTKRLLQYEGFTVAPDVVLEPADIRAGNVQIPFELPVVVKPSAEGSSVATFVVQQPEELETALQAAAERGRVLVEAFVPGPEVTVAILNGRAMPPVEIRPREGFYDYRNKYTRGCTSYICPAEISVEMSDSVQRLALRACELTGVEGVARVDFMAGGEDGPVILEINTIPGMTELSLVPMAAREAGYSFEDVAEMILSSARLRKVEEER